MCGLAIVPNRKPDMRVLFTSDKIAAAPGKLSALISAFDAARPGRGWQYRCNADDMRAELESRGYYTGHNDAGHYLVVNLDLLRVEPHPSFEDENGGKGRTISAALFAEG